MTSNQQKALNLKGFREMVRRLGLEPRTKKSVMGIVSLSLAWIEDGRRMDAWNCLLQSGICEKGEFFWL